MGLSHVPSCSKMNELYRPTAPRLRKGYPNAMAISISALCANWWWVPTKAFLFLMALSVDGIRPQKQPDVTQARPARDHQPQSNTKGRRACAHWSFNRFKQLRGDSQLDLNFYVPTTIIRTPENSIHFARENFSALLSDSTIAGLHRERQTRGQCTSLGQNEPALDFEKSSTHPRINCKRA